MALYRGRIQLLQKSSTDWSANDAVLLAGQIGAANVGSMTPILKIGDGVRPWSQLPNLMAPVDAANDYVAGPTTTLPPGSAATVTIDNTVDPPTISFGIPRGNTGPANTLAIGTVTTGAPGSSAAATITGAAPNQTLNLTIPQGQPSTVPGPPGPANTLAIGTVTTGAPGSAAGATITGAAPNQTLSLTIPQGAVGPQGIPGPQGEPGSAGTVLADNSHVTGDWVFDPTQFFGYTVQEVADVKANSANVGYSASDALLAKVRMRLHNLNAGTDISFSRVNGAFTAPTYLTGSDTIGDLTWRATGPSGVRQSALIRGTATETHTASAGGTGVEIYATRGGTIAVSRVMQYRPEFITVDTEMRSRGLGRFGGWYNAPGPSDVSGPALEVGVSGGYCVAQAYDRTGAAYQNLKLIGAGVGLYSGAAAVAALRVNSANECELLVNAWHKDSSGNARINLTDLGRTTWAAPNYQFAWRGSGAAGDIGVLSGGATNTTSFSIYSPSGQLVCYRLSQTGQRSWLMQVPANSTALQWFDESGGVARMTLGIDGQLTVGGNVAARGGTLYLGASDWAAARNANDNWLRLNPDGSYTSGVYTGGTLRSGSYVIADSAVRAPVLTNLTNNITLTANFSGSGYTYGSWIAAGLQGGYAGIALSDGARYPTFMSDGTNVGVYSQGGGWLWMDNNSSFAITHATSAPSFNSTSSRALKRETGKPTRAADMLAKLRPILYRLLKGDDREQLGLIAEEVHEVCPQMSDGKTVAYDRLALLLLADWQESRGLA